MPGEKKKHSQGWSERRSQNSGYNPNSQKQLQAALATKASQSSTNTSSTATSQGATTTSTAAVTTAVYCCTWNEENKDVDANGCTVPGHQ